MNYAEFLPPQPLRPLVKLAWVLDCGGDVDAWVEQIATPDGCIEIIRRLRGRSRWDGAQPEQFVAGLITRPSRFEASGDAAFVALRLWPWAWNAFAAVPSALLVDRWMALEAAAPGFCLAADPESAFACYPPGVAPETAELGAAILAAGGPGDLARRTGRPLRWLQRWFRHEIGVPPGHYLRLLRFQETLAAMQDEPMSLAAHAAAQGYADQAHMSREFRRLSGLPARLARRRATGPFV